MSAKKPVLLITLAALAFSGLVSSFGLADKDPSSISQEFLSFIKGLRKNRTVSPGSVTTLEAFFAEADRFKTKDPDYAKRMKSSVKKISDAAELGDDVVAKKRGFFWRGYQTRHAKAPQLYSIYVPKNYDSGREWPLIVSLHGGSSNHNAWMAMILGHEFPPTEYRRNFRTEFKALNHQDKAIIVAPQGLGQNYWMWVAEQDILNVINDVKQNYNIDEDKIILNGLSNGAIASYRVGLTNAWQFAAVIPMSGIVDWINHSGRGSVKPAERVTMELDAPISLAENAFNTNFQFYHGVRDSGFNVNQARSFANKLSRLGIQFDYNEIPNLGHHITHLLWRDLKILKYLEKYERNDRPNEVRLVTGSERDNRQFWVVMEDRVDHRRLARIRAKFGDGGVVTVETNNVRRLTLLMDEGPFLPVKSIVVDGQIVDPGPRLRGDPITLETVAPYSDLGKLYVDQPPKNTIWQLGHSNPVAEGSGKRARLAGPIGDVSYEPQIHVYGTRVPFDTNKLRNAAKLGARGWVRDPEFTQIRHPVVADVDLTPEMMKDRALVLYGNAKNNSVLARIGQELPIQVGENYIGLRGKRYYDNAVGAKFIYPNPLMPKRYVLVQAGVSAQAVERAGVLPIFTGDYVVFDKRFKSKSQRLVLGRNQDIESGFFTEDWLLPEKHLDDKSSLAMLNTSDH